MSHSRLMKLARDSVTVSRNLDQLERQIGNRRPTNYQLMRIRNMLKLLDDIDREAVELMRLLGVKRTVH